jgi:hypothetical protein
MGKTERNKLVIIGNGFDLAHGFKTSYSDFILWYLNEFIELGFSLANHSDVLMNAEGCRNNFPKKTEERYVNSIGVFQAGFVDNKLIELKSEFFYKLINKQQEQNWVDIEKIYYDSLIEVYKKTQAMHNKSLFEELNKLNKDLEFLRNKLEEYLTQIQQEHIDKLIPNFNQNFGYIVQDDWYNSFKDTDKRIVFLNFNYTNTIEYYTKKANTRKTKDEIIYIHGKLNDPNNPMIFGYGDEMDEHYKKIELLNNNEFLKHFKSFGYFKTNNYQKLLSFIESDFFDVEIVGHSCGLSDRVLLNTIFEHDNCEAIKIHYYENAKGENDFTYKTQEISRHFNDKAKAKMRKRIIDLSNCKALTC